MARFVETEVLTADEAVQKVLDTQHDQFRVRRSLWNLPKSEWEEARERFRDLAQLAHPALPQLVAVGEEQRILTLVEDYVDGKTLEERLAEEEPLPIEKAVALLIPIVQAVGAMHKLFMGHGGIDTRSIIIDGEGQSWLVGAGAREALPDSDFEALAEVLVRCVLDPTEESVNLVHDLRVGKLRDCKKLLQRLAELVPEGALDGAFPGLDDTFGYTEPLSAEVEEEADSESEDDFDWVGVSDENETRRRADDRKMLRWFGIGTAAIAVVGLIASVDLGGSSPPPSDTEDVAEAVELASIAPPDGLEEDEIEVARVDGLGKWRVQRVEGRRHPSTTIELEAENSVKDRLNRSGFPVLHIRCAEHELAVSVTPGVDTVEAFVAKDASYAKHADLAFTWEGTPSEHLQADFRPDSPELDLRSVAPILKDAPRAQSLYLSYTPFASDSVIAIFDVRGMDRAMGALGRFCELP
ncbi:MAG: hypothetical protein AAGA48_33545 [Myxococcota bacterium]